VRDSLLVMLFPATTALLIVVAELSTMPCPTSTLSPLADSGRLRNQLI